MTLPRRTPLYEMHRALGARLIEFAGWEMPVQYTNILDEHRAVRTAAGLFDISHMGEVYVSGPAAELFLNHLLTNAIGKIAVGSAQYNLMCNERGGVIDDLIVYRIASDRFLLVINAACIDRDLAWMRQQNHRDATLEDASQITGAIALQGPKTSEIAERLLPWISQKIPRHGIARQNYKGVELWIARTGYTGEDGFEIFLPAEFTASAWEAIFASGTDLGLKPCGLGARDTLRLEMCYPLNGSDLSEMVTPIEAGLDAFVALHKPEFIGKETLQSQKTSGPSKRLTAFQMAGKGALPRPHCAMISNGKRIGEVTSGTLSPSLGIGIGMGYVEAAHTNIGNQIAIEIRGKPHPATIVAKPFYHKPKHP